MMLSAVLCVENVDKQELGQAVKSWMCGSVRARACEVVGGGACVYVCVCVCVCVTVCV